MRFHGTILVVLLGVAGVALGQVAVAGEVRVGARTAFTLTAAVAGMSPQERADIVNRRIEEVLTNPRLDPGQVAARTVEDSTTAVGLGDWVIVAVTEGDAAADGTSVAKLADRWARILRAEITQLKPLYAQKRRLRVQTLTEHHVLLLLLQVAVLLLAARACGEIAARWGQPPVIGQLLAGVLLGHSVLGMSIGGVVAPFVLGFGLGLIVPERLLGAFVIGVVLSGSPLVGENVVRPIECVTMGIFAPIFFAAAGLHVNLGILADPLLLTLTLGLTAAACVGKIAGCYAGGRWSGLGTWESLSVGLGANARGAMGLIIGILGFSLGILTLDGFSMIIVMALLTTAMTPPLLRLALTRVQPSPEEESRLNREALQARSFLKRIGRVLLPTSGGPHSGIAARLLAAIGQERALEVTALPVAPKGLNAQGNAAFDLVSKPFQGAKATLLPRSLTEGEPVEAILREAARGYDLLALGCGSDTGVRGAIFGRVADAMARRSPCALLVVRAPADVATWTPRHILVPTPGAVHGTLAAELAVAMARSTAARITALYVVPEQDEILFWLPHEHQQADDLAREVVEEVVALGEPFGVRVDAIVRTGHHAATEIVRVAAETQADLVLLSGSLRPTERLFLGHTIAYVLKRAHCAVAVVKP